MAYGDSPAESLAIVRQWIASSSGVDEYMIGGRRVRRSLKQLCEMEKELEWQVADGNNATVSLFQIDKPGAGV